MRKTLPQIEGIIGKHIKFEEQVNFKRDAVVKITARGYAVAEVSKRLGVSQHSLYAWRKKFLRPWRLGALGLSLLVGR